MKNNKKTATLVLIAATGINVLNAVLYTWSSISSCIITEWGWSSKQASLPYTIYTVFFVLAMVAFGDVMDEKGPKILATLGSILLGAGLILSGFTKSHAVMLVTIGIIGGNGVGLHTVSTVPTAIKWYPPCKKGFITGIVSSGAALSTLFYSLLVKYLLDNIGINKTFFLLGIIILVFTIILSQFLKNPDNNSDLKNVNADLLESEDIKNVVSYDWRYMLKDTCFYKLWIMMSFSSSAGLMIISHIVTIAKVQGNLDIGYILLVVLAVFNCMGKIVGGMISDKIGRINLLRFLFVIQGLNMLFFNAYVTLITMIIGVVIVGFCYGSIFSVFPAAISDKYGSRYYGKNYGLIFTAWGFSGIIGPMTAAAVFDATSQYTFAYIIAFLLLFISTIIAFSIRNDSI